MFYRIPGVKFVVYSALTLGSIHLHILGAGSKGVARGCTGYTCTPNWQLKFRLEHFSESTLN